MIGVPKRYNTVTDLENAHTLALKGRLPAASVRRAWEALLNTQQVYVFNQALASESERTGPEPDYRVLTGQGESGDEIHEFKLVDDPNGRINKLGYSPSEVENKISELE